LSLVDDDVPVRDLRPHDEMCEFVEKREVGWRPDLVLDPVGARPI
jgi:hypothetical protein